MRLRYGFVSNSSSCSFIVHNRTDNRKNIYDLAVELAYMVDEFNIAYDHDFTVDSFMAAVVNYNYVFEPHSDTYVEFGDEDCNAMGHVFDYMMRDGGISPSFSWSFDQYLR